MSRRHGAVLLTVGGLVTAPLHAPAAMSAQELHVDREGERRAAFVSRTTLDTFRGTTEAVDGYVLLDGDGVRPVDGPVGELYFEVDLASIDTGIELRNRHMRENYLEVEAHPYATFEAVIDSIRAADVGFGVWASGTFTAHGVERPRTVACDAIPEPEGFRVVCGFPVLLSDHDIDIPRLMFMRLAEEVRVELDFHLRRVGPPRPSPYDREAS